MSTLTMHSPFAVVVSVAAEIYKATLVAKKISLASSNAGVLSARAGDSAAGFGALAKFIDELARKTVIASNDINNQAVNMSRLVSKSVNTQMALKRFNKVKNKAKEAEYYESLVEPLEKIRQSNAKEQKAYEENLSKINVRLQELLRDIDIAKVLASMSQVEAVQAATEYQGQLSDNATNISEASKQIEAHITKALQLLRNLEEVHLDYVEP